MASNPNPPKTEFYSNDAYFEIIMLSDLYKEIPDRVMKNPKFWDFLESRASKADREKWADAKLRRKLDKDTTDPDQIRASGKTLEEAKAIEGGECMLQKCEEELKAEYASIPEGDKFQYLRDSYCGVDEGEEERETRSVGERTEKENGESRAQDWEVWESTGSESEAEERPFKGNAVTADGMAGKDNGKPSAERRQVWEWTDSDAEAEEWLFERDAMRARGMAGKENEKPSAEVRMVLEWTEYDSEAEREEAERQLL